MEKYDELCNSREYEYTELELKKWTFITIQFVWKQVQNYLYESTAQSGNANCRRSPET